MRHAKRRYMLLILLCFFTLLTGCLTYQGQLDTSVPMKEQVTLKVSLPLHLVAVDGKDVDPGLIGTPSVGSGTIRLPIGEHSLDLEYKSLSSDSRYQYYITGSASVTYNFEPGYSYTAIPYTSIMGSLIKDIDTAVILKLSSNFQVAILKNEKSQSSAIVSFESGVIMGASMKAINKAGLDIGIIPFGLVLDTRKISFGFTTDLSMNVGWAPNPYKDVYKKNNWSNPGYGVDLELNAGGLFGLYLNGNKGKAFGLGFGGGYTTSLLNLIGGANYEKDLYKVDIPKGMWYLRGAIIPSRRMKFTLYFDYYLKNLTNELPAWKDFYNAAYTNGSIDEEAFYKVAVHHPRSWNAWGVGILIRLY